MGEGMWWMEEFDVGSDLLGQVAGQASDGYRNP